MTGFELQTYGIGSDRSTNWATTTAHTSSYVATVAAIKHTLAMYEGWVYWFSPGFSAMWLACQLLPMSGLILSDVYAPDPLAHFPDLLLPCSLK